MKLLFALFAALLSTLLAFSQSVPVPQPIEKHHPVSYWWWVIGVIIAIGAGVLLYLLIKKDPRKDAVR